MSTAMKRVARITSEWLSLVLLVSHVVPAYAAASYTLTPIPCPPDTPVAGYASMNDAGQVALTCFSADFSRIRGILLSRGTATDIGVLPGFAYTFALGISNRGEVVGASLSADFSSERPIVFRNGTLEELPVYVGHRAAANSINDAGTIAGSYDEGDFFLHAFVITRGVATDLGSLGGALSQAEAVNNRGQVAGSSLTTAQFWHAFLYENGEMTDVTPGVSVINALVNGLNNHGEVVGSVTTSAREQHAFVWRNGQFTELPGFGGRYWLAHGINDAGQIVGGSTLPGDSVSHAFLYWHGVMTDLNDLVSTASPLKPYVTLDTGWAINNSGWMLVWGVDTRTSEWGFYLLRP